MYAHDTRGTTFQGDVQAQESGRGAMVATQAVDPHVVLVRKRFLNEGGDVLQLHWPQR